MATQKRRLARGVLSVHCALIAVFGLPYQVNAQMAAATHFDVSNGAATYTIPIEIPAGQSGLAPSLALSYNSQTQDGLFGIGWQLSGLSSITRCPRTLSQDGVDAAVSYVAADRYCLDGQRLILVAGKHGVNGAEYRTEKESFSKIIVHELLETVNGPGSFTVKTAGGLTMEYAKTADSRIQLYGTGVVSQWLLNRVYDSVGNYYDVSYNKDVAGARGSYIPGEIQWGGNLKNGSPHTQKISFDIISRADPYVGYTAGSPVVVRHLVSGIGVQVGSDLFRRYDLSYASATGNGTVKSLLAEAKECNTAGQCRRIMAADYEQTSVVSPYSATWGVNGAWGTHGYFYIGDFNGDGMSDIASATGGNVYLKLSNGSGFTNAIWPVDANWSTEPYTWTADFNGDGRADIASAIGGSVYMKLSNPSGTGFVSQTWSVTPQWGADGFYWVGDFNGDGMADIASALHGNVFMKLSNGTGTQFISEVWPVSDAWSTQEYTWIGDFNGDGKADIASADGASVYMKLSIPGQSGFKSEIWAVNGAWGGHGYFWVGDFNGDGLTDIASAAGGNVYMKLSTGTGFVNEIWPVDASWGASEFIRIGDFNGDGMADIASPQYGSIHVKYSTGTGFRSFTYPVSASWSPADYTYVADFNGDGRADFASANGVNVFMKLFSGPRTLATRFEDIFGSVIRIDYRSLVDMNGSSYFRDVPGTASRTNAIPTAVVVASATRSDGVGGETTAEYSYANLLFDIYGNGRGSLGYQWVQSVDKRTGVVSRSYYLQDWPYTGTLQKTGKGVAGSWNNLSESVNADFSCNVLVGLSLVSECGSSSYAQANKRFFIYPRQIDSRAWDYTGINQGDGEFIPLPRTRTRQVLDEYGNAQSVRVETLLPDDTPSGFSKLVENVYAPVDKDKWHLGRLLRSKVTSTSP